MDELQIEQFLRGRILTRVEMDERQITLTFERLPGLARKEDKLLIKLDTSGSPASLKATVL